MAEAVKSEHPSRKYWILGAIVLVIVVYVAAQYFGPYTRMARYVRSPKNAVELQAWARDVLAKPPQGEGADVVIPPQEWPQVVRAMPIDKVFYVKPVPGLGAFVRIVCGNAYYHYGLHIGAADYTPLEKSQYQYEKLGPGMWGFSPAAADKGRGE